MKYKWIRWIVVIAALLLLAEAAVFVVVVARKTGAARPTTQTQLATQQTLDENIPEPEVKPEDNPDPVPTTVACRYCTVEIELGTHICPYCEWDQTMDPADLPVLIPCRKCGEEMDETLTICPACEWDQSRDPAEKEVFTITMVGDCTLASDKSNYGGYHTFVGVVGDDYDYPFANVRPIFEADEFTIINLECNLTDNAIYSNMYFSFRGPTAYTKIMSGSSVEMVSYSNNHIVDYGQTGYDETIAALEADGLAYVERDSSTVYVTENGITIGVYAGMFWGFDENDLVAEITELDKTCDIVIASLHWGDEGKYRPTAEQERLGKLAIDSGADIVYGHHPHVLQKIETYNDGIIYYSLGNFSFGGHTNPRDKDTVIVQQQILRDSDGNVTLGEHILLPCCVSGKMDANTYQPTLYEEGTEEYDRVLSKLDGSFEGPDLVVKYD